MRACSDRVPTTATSSRWARTSPGATWAIGRRSRIAVAVVGVCALLAAGGAVAGAPAELPRARRPRPGRADHRGHDRSDERAEVRRGRPGLVRRRRCRPRARRRTRRQARSCSSPASRRRPWSYGSPLSSGGKPEVLYVGTEFCPYCAAESWSLIVALSRFGQFSGLQHQPLPVVRGHPADRRLDLLRLVLHEQLPGLRPGRDLLQRPRQAATTTRAARRAIARCSGSRPPSRRS